MPSVSIGIKLESWILPGNRGPGDVDGGQLGLGPEQYTLQGLDFGLLALNGEQYIGLFDCGGL